jgi:hypothetical protein
VVYGLGRIDASGRIADRAIISALGSPPHCAAATGRVNQGCRRHHRLMPGHEGAG